MFLPHQYQAGWVKLFYIHCRIYFKYYMLPLCVMKVFLWWISLCSDVNLVSACLGSMFNPMVPKVGAWSDYRDRERQKNHSSPYIYKCQIEVFFYLLSLPTQYICEAKVTTVLHVQNTVVGCSVASYLHFVKMLPWSHTEIENLGFFFFFFLYCPVALCCPLG